MLFLLSVHGPQITLTYTVYVSFSVGIHMCISPIMCGKQYCFAGISLSNTCLSFILQYLLYFLLVYIIKRQYSLFLPSSQLLYNENNVRNVFYITEQSSIPFRYWLLISSRGLLLQQYTRQAAVVLSNSIEVGWCLNFPL